MKNGRTPETGNRIGRCESLSVSRKTCKSEETCIMGFIFYFFAFSLFSMDPASLSIFLILLLLLVFFAGTEIPLMSVSEHVIASAVKKRRFGAVTLQKIKAQNERLLMTNLVGTTAVTIAISSFSTVVALDFSREFSLPGELGVTAAMLAVSTIILLIGEIAPKILGVRFSDQVAFIVAPVYRILMWVLFPVNWLIEYYVRFVSFLTGAHSDLHDQKMTQEEFEAFIDISHEK